MKLTKKFYSLLLLIPLVALSCVRNPDAPQIEEPHYDGTDNITVAELKQIYASISDPVEIDSDYVLKGTVIGNDKSGNIYKQLYIRDKQGNGINIGVDQNSVYNFYQVGQEVFIELHNLAMVKYGGELQIGMLGTNANRIEWNKFREVAHRNGFPNAENAQPVVKKITELGDADVNTLIRIDNIYFVNGGTAQFAPGTATNEEQIKDGDGNTLITRNSNYSDFAKETLPEGGGSIVGILGRYNGSWQLFIRDINDLIDFGGQIPGGTDPEPGGDTFFTETFGEKFTQPSGGWPAPGEFTGYDNGSPVTFSATYDGTTPRVSIRNTTALDNHVWFASGYDTALTIGGINASGKSNVVLSFQLAANVSTSGAAEADLGKMKVSVNGTSYTLPSKVVTAANSEGNRFFDFEVGPITVSAATEIVFSITGADNNAGLRLDNVKLTADSGSTPIPPDPEPGSSVYKETFGVGNLATADRKKIGDYTEFDNSSPIVYSDATVRSDIRTVGTGSTDRHVWFPASTETNPQATLVVTGINTAGKTGLTLSFDIAANLYSAGESINLNAMKLKINGTEFTVPSKEVSNENGDNNKFHTLQVTGVPASDNLTIEFSAGTENTKGLRLDNVEITAAS